MKQIAQFFLLGEGLILIFDVVLADFALKQTRGKFATGHV